MKMAFRKKSNFWRKKTAKESLRKSEVEILCKSKIINKKSIET